MIHHIYEHYHMHVKELIPLAPIKAFDSQQNLCTCSNWRNGGRSTCRDEKAQ